MSKYFVHYSCGSKCKNSAESEADAYIRTLDGTLLKSIEGRHEFVKNVKSEIGHINQRNRRCRDVLFHTWGDNGTLNIGIAEGVGYLRIYRVNREE